MAIPFCCVERYRSYLFSCYIDLKTVEAMKNNYPWTIRAQHLLLFLLVATPFHVQGWHFQQISQVVTKIRNHVLSRSLYSFIPKLLLFFGMYWRNPTLSFKLNNYFINCNVEYYLDNWKPNGFSTACRNLDLFCRSDFHYFRNEDISVCAEACHVSWHWNRTDQSTACWLTSNLWWYHVHVPSNLLGPGNTISHRQ
jgi:hypothetical protein